MTVVLERAIQILRAKLYDIIQEQQEEVTSLRRSQVGTGARGDIDQVMEACISQDQQERLEQLASTTE